MHCAPFHLRSVLLALLLAVFPLGSLLAQETLNFASLGGRVLDPSGAVVTGADVTVRHTETNVAIRSTTDGAGLFRFPYLRVGPYQLIVSRPGFSEASRNLTLTVGSAFDVSIGLTVSGLADTVQVTAEGAVIETARSQMAGTVARTEVRDLPLNGRNFLDLALLIPGVSPTNVGGGTQLFPETSGVPGVGISVGSQRNLSNNFIVDGLSANDDAAGLGGITYGVDAVDQFQVVTSGGQAELGRALGGYVNIVTRSGTNAWLGEVYEFQRDSRWNAPNALSGSKLPMKQSQYGGSFGGPLMRDRSFIFSNFEQRRLDQSGLVTIDPSNAGAINARLDAAGYAGPRVATGQYRNPVDTTNALLKIDHQVSGADHLSLRYSLYDVASSNARGAGALNAPSASAGLESLDQTIAVGNIRTLSDRTVNESRAQVAFSSLNALPTDPTGPMVSIAGVATFGTSSGSPTARRNTLYQFVDNVSHQRGAHALRFGVDFLYNDLGITYPRAARGSYSFSSLSNFLAGVYNNAGFSQTFGESAVDQNNPNLGVYVQDEWKAAAKLTLNAGLRYDLQWLETIRTDLNNVSPRLGFAWQPDDEGRTVVRGSAGVFYDRVPLRALANALLSAGNTTDVSNLRQIIVTLSPAQTAAPVFPATLGAVVPSVTLANITTMDRNLTNAFSRQASFEVERQVGSRATVSIGFQHLKGHGLLMSVNQNVPTCVAAAGNNGCRPHAEYGNNSQYTAAGSSRHDALHVSYVQRPMRWGSFRISYTLSKSMNDVGEFFFSSPIDPADISKDWGRSDDDQRHRLVFNGSVHTSMGPAGTVWQKLTHGFQLSGMAQYYSALPFNITSGVTTVQGTAGRPMVNGAFIPRNAGEGTAFSSVSLRLSRMVRIGARTQIEALVEAFNLLNRRNVMTRNTSFGAGAYPDSPSAAFGQVTAVGEPRTLQAGIRVRF